MWRNRYYYCQILIKFDLSRNYLKNTQISNLMKICLVEAELFHKKGRTNNETELTKLIVALYSFTNKPKQRKLH